jgi:hypothetical protein
LGDSLRVTIADANLTRRQVTLALERKAEPVATSDRKRIHPSDGFDQGESKPRGWPPAGFRGKPAGKPGPKPQKGRRR